MARLYISEHEPLLNPPYILGYSTATQVVEIPGDATAAFSSPLKVTTRVIRLVADDDCMICLVKNEEFAEPGMRLSAGVVELMQIPTGWISFYIGVMSELY